MLSKRWLINSLLILVIAISALVGYRYQSQSVNQATNAITRLKPAEISSITIHLPDKNIVLRKSEGLWLIDSPLQWPAHGITIERILGIATSQAESSFATEGVDLAPLGLLDPQVRLSLNDVQISFGTSNNIGDRRYLMVGSTIYLLADIHYPFIIQGIAGLIDKRLLPPSISLQSLNLEGRILTRGNSGSWQSSLSTDIPADQLNYFVNNWQSLEVPVVKIFKQGGMPLERIVAGLTDDSKIEFLLMSIEPELVIARVDLGVQYHFSEIQYQQLFSFTSKGP
jgi:hypothetical protein